MTGLKETWAKMPTPLKVFLAFVAIVIVGDILTQGGAL